MAWKIRAAAGLAGMAFAIDDEDNQPKGHIAFEAGRWRVRFVDAPALDWDLATDREQAIGYVRGIERAAIVNAKETGRSR